jgi:hypothetical protein
MFRFGSSPTGITPHCMHLIGTSAIEAPLNFLSAAEGRGEEAQLQLTDELSDIGVTELMAANLEELCRLSGANNRSISKVFGPAVRDHAGPELYNRLTEGWTGNNGRLLVTAYFKLTRVARVATGGLPATGDPGVCKVCTKPPVAGNYGFCHECRAPTKKQKK